MSNPLLSWEKWENLMQFLKKYLLKSCVALSLSLSIYCLLYDYSELKEGVKYSIICISLTIFFVLLYFLTKEDTDNADNKGSLPQKHSQEQENHSQQHNIQFESKQSENEKELVFHWVKKTSIKEYRSKKNT